MFWQSFPENNDTELYRITFLNWITINLKYLENGLSNSSDSRICHLITFLCINTPSAAIPFKTSVGMQPIKKAIFGKSNFIDQKLFFFLFFY